MPMRSISFFCLHLLWVTCSVLGQQRTVILENGMTIGPGLLGNISGFDVSKGEAIKAANETQSRNIILVDDELRKTFFHRRMIAKGTQPIDRIVPLPRITLNNAKRRVEGKDVVAGISSSVYHTPFDDFGRRMYIIETASKTHEILQGITEVTPNAIHVESLNIENAPVWDMRLAFTAVPPDRMLTILLKDADLRIESDWLDIINLLIEARRYADAMDVLKRAIVELPEMAVHSNQFPILKQAVADQLFEEVQLRRKAGQYQFSDAIMRGFNPKDLSDETKLKIQKRLLDNQNEKERQQGLVRSLRLQVDQLADRQMTESLQPILNEIETKLSSNSVERLSDYDRLRDDASMSIDDRVAIGLSGWLLGNGSNVKSLKMVQSILEAKPLVIDYLRSDDLAQRQDALDKLRKLEAGVPRYIAPMIAKMEPYRDLPEPVEGNPSRYLLEVSLGNQTGGEIGQYYLQLPPEYDPNRLYPCVVTLNGETSDELRQLNWWTGDYNPDWRMTMGEASRNGYIVLSPRWRRPDQIRYESTENEHHRVLACLRDAMRRTSIDSNRVFISGHNLGADAAWDIGLAHPDLWAGMIIIGGDHNRYVTFYRPNARYVPSYFVMGEYDGAPAPLARVGKELDEYAKATWSDFMLVMYTGRGRDHFQEELTRIVDWMNLASHRRKPTPQELLVKSARPGDYFFWWLEVQEFAQGMMNHPLLEFDPKRVVEIKAERNPISNVFSIQTLAANRLSIWLSPDTIDFDKLDKVIVILKGKKATYDLNPQLEVLLEDVRTRADRQRPFWARIDLP